MAAVQVDTVKVFEMPRVKRVLQGVGSRHRLAEEIKSAGGTRAMLVTGHSLGSTTIFRELVAELGALAVGVFTQVKAHNPVEIVAALIHQARELKADIFVGVGGGSPIDAAKLASLGIVEGVTNPKELAAYAVQFEYPDKEYVKPLRGSPAPVVAIPTTLSAAEWDGFAGSVDSERGVKDVARYLELTPAIVFLDPELCALTPRELWATTGVRAVDHAVETIYARNAHPVTTYLSLGALELLARHLPSSVGDALDFHAAMQCQIAEWMSIVGVHNVSLGLSHAIGHQLGALGVPHGVTSCIMLPHVMRFLAPATREEQERIAAALRKGLGVQEGSAADLIERLFNQLGVPRRISQFNVSRDKMSLIADATMADVVARESPVPIIREIIVGLLETAW